MEKQFSFFYINIVINKKEIKDSFMGKVDRCEQYRNALKCLTWETL